MSSTIVAPRRDSAAPCPLCRSEAKFQFTKLEEQYFRCDCGFVFISPRPSEPELREMYLKQGDEYWTTNRMVNFAFSPTKSRREIRFVQRFADKGTLLDIGCSTGSFVKAACEAGFDAEGVDISAPAVLLGQKLGLPLHVLDILHERPGKEYDLVTMWATVEHLGDPRNHLSRARQLLKPGGLLFVSVPNYAGISQKLLGKWDRYVGNGHLNYFTPRVLQRALEKENLRLRGTTTYGFNPFVIIKDLKTRGKSQEVNEVLADQETILRLKQSPLLYGQRLMEQALNVFSAADVVAVCGQAI
jgi:2-polyprenyl-3-methyl-5-hydroxy-6-metoxy-1,4-benzoquinol methylase